MKKLFLSTLIIATLLLLIGCTAVSFDISFVSDGEVVHTISTSGSKTIALPENPTKNGYVFEGWYWDKDTWQKPFTANSLLNEPLTTDMTVYAKWTPEEIPPQNYNVIFDSMGGSSVNGQVLLFGDLINKPVDPIKTNYAFGGWYLDKEYTVTWDFAVGIVTENTTLYARWIDKYLVTLNVNGGTLSSESEGEFYIVDGEKISQLPTPTRELYTFGGWYKDEACTTPWSLGTDDITENTILYAKWIKNHLVTLDANGGTLSEDVETEFYRQDNESIGKLPTPERNGYTFLGWYDVDDITLEEKITRTFEVEYDIDLIAQWQKNASEDGLVTVELILGTDESLAPDNDGYTPSSVIKLETGSALGKLPNAQKDGYKFIGWFNDKDVMVLEDTIVDSDLTLIAKWKKCCIDGVYDTHNWAVTGGFQLLSEATCTTAEVRERVCGVPGCGAVETISFGSPLGHDCNSWDSTTPMKLKGTCYRCNEPVVKDMVNVTPTAMGNNTPVIDSTSGAGFNQGASLVDGNWENCYVIGCMQPMTVTLELENTTMVEVIYVAGYGNASYTITWYDENGDECGFSTGCFGDTSDGSYVTRFHVNCEISKVVIYMESPGYYQNSWAEICLAQYPEE
ncbi:MAG: InlB B-repeat-containing protein [Clostridia bacterium]|nr:InlB B-repeat-containing protein [Clostridia bacterium]